MTLTKVKFNLDTYAGIVGKTDVFSAHDPEFIRYARRPYDGIRNSEYRRDGREDQEVAGCVLEGAVVEWSLIRMINGVSSSREFELHDRESYSKDVIDPVTGARFECKAQFGQMIRWYNNDGGIARLRKLIAYAKEGRFDFLVTGTPYRVGDKLHCHFKLLAKASTFPKLLKEETDSTFYMDQVARNSGNAYHYLKKEQYANA
jgi:hypothetical protein